MDRALGNIPALIGLSVLEVVLLGGVIYAAISAAVGLDACTYRGCGASWWGAQAINVALIVAVLVMLVTVVWGLVATLRGRAGHRAVAAGCAIQGILLSVLMVIALT
ncbi:hypothetical protein ACWDTI_00490 [Gordonia sp. NPDC003424]